MARPRYETESDRKAELSIVKYASALWGFDWKKLPISYRADFAFFQHGKLHGFGEAKVRSNKKNDYPTYFISSEKVRAMMELSMFHMKPFIILVKWSDELGYWKWAPSEPYLHLEMRWGGRTDRNDSQDEEIMMHIPTSKFIRIKKL